MIIAIIDVIETMHFLYPMKVSYVHSSSSSTSPRDEIRFRVRILDAWRRLPKELENPQVRTVNSLGKAE